MAARPPSVHLTGTSTQGSEIRGQESEELTPDSWFLTPGKSEPETLMGRREERAKFWDAVFCNRPPSLRDGEGRNRRSGNGSGIEPVKMFAAVRGSPSCGTAGPIAESALVSVRIVKLATSYFFRRRNSVPSAVRTLDFETIKRLLTPH